MIKPVCSAMIAALTLSVAALAQPASGAGGQGATATPAAEKKASSRVLRGEIEKVDLEAKSVTVVVRKGGRETKVVVETDASTQFIVNGNVATIADIRKGMSATVLPDVGVATKVTAKTAKRPPRRTQGSTTKPARTSK